MILGLILFGFEEGTLRSTKSKRGQFKRTEELIPKREQIIYFQKGLLLILKVKREGQ